MRWIADGRMLYAPSDLINYMESDFVSWMDRLYKLFPDQFQPDESDDNTKILQAHGDRHEREFLSLLASEGKDICEIVIDGNALESTLDAMRAGREVIYQGVLALEPFEGRSDFLVRCDGVQSIFGNYAYEVWDTKLARKPKPYFIIQLCSYAEMLQHTQGVLPSEIAVVLGNKQIQKFRTADYFNFYSSLKEAFLNFQNNFDAEQMPQEIKLPVYSRWNSHGEDILEKRDDLIRVANIRKSQINKLKAAGITAMKALAGTEKQHIAKMLPSTFAALKQQARLQVESAGLSKPLFELLPANELDIRTGLVLLPPPSSADVFFDMEGYPHLEGGLEYLFGATYLDQHGEPQFIDWWAHNREEERLAFENFIDWISQRFQQNPAMHVYHYASYEVSAMRRLMGRHGTREAQLDHLLRNEVFVDLYQLVRQSLRVGEPSYSIKNIEHLYMEKRSGAVAKATDSVVYYERWLENEEDTDWKHSRTLKAIRDYNKDDCDSTWLLAKWLWQLQTDNGIKFIPRGPQCGSKVDEEIEGEVQLPASPSKQKGSGTKQIAESLMLEMLAEVPPGASEERWRLHQLLAWLLCFHDREYKPVYWARFDRHNMTEEQLIDDLDCLGALQSDDTCTWKQKAPGNRSRSFQYEFSFDPNQDTKIAETNDVLFAHDLSVTATVVKLDRDAGRVVLKLGSTKEEPPRRLSIIPKDFAGERSIADSILRVVFQWRLSGQLPQAIEDFLRRRQPRIKGHTKGTALVPDDANSEKIAEVVAALDRSTLSIQGPPGSGKTYTGSVVIEHLLSKGFKVGITSNSHAAIEQLMGKTLQRCSDSGVTAHAVKIGGNQVEGQVTWKRSARDLFEGQHSQYNLIGGTAFAFANPLACDTVDFLFVDEAGQVSIANLVGVSPCTKNIVLLGDQMQLDQPIQGSHPGESGLSTLDYLLGDNATVAPEMGVFLGTTRRMRPEICSVVSEMVYENRLHSHSDTLARALVGPDKPRHLRKDNGILFLPVEHDGNTQGSAEEAAVVAEVIDELLQCRFADGTNEPRNLTMADILVVAPYNMQVRLIQKYCPDVRAGSVDKFQGQEAPVLILSMCTSDGGASPRGIDFVFSRNRLNVALSRAQCLAIVIGNPNLAMTHCSTIKQMQLVNFFCRIKQEGIDSNSDRDTTVPTGLLVPPQAYVRIE
jgi:predicted RecB family nuclease